MGIGETGLASERGRELSKVSRLFVRVGLGWCAAVVIIGASAAGAEWEMAQPGSAIEGALTLSAIALFPGIVCLVLSWVLSPPSEDDDPVGGAGSDRRTAK